MLESPREHINIFLHISKIGESFGYVIAESLLCETPVVTLNTPWADNSQSELVGNRKGGFTIFQKKNFIKAVQMLINDEKLRLSFSRYEAGLCFHLSMIRIV